MADVPLLVTSENSSSERRITPSWSISQLKSKLEPITGIPPSCQRLKLKTSANETVAIEAQDEDATLLSNFRLAPYAELQVRDIPYVPRATIFRCPLDGHRGAMIVQLRYLLENCRR